VLPQLYERELEYLVREEFARTCEDILWRRSKLGLHLMKLDTSPLERWLEGRNLPAPALTPQSAEAP
jgi:glycerol-3-phosphate dehydrogenase